MRNCYFAFFRFLLLQCAICASFVQLTEAQVSGTFTINSSQVTGGGNFNRFSEAVASLSGGVNGPVIFNVTTSAATYNEQLVLPAIAGVSAANTITFNGNGNTIAWLAPGNDQPAVVKLTGADHVTINNLAITALGSDEFSGYGWGILITNNSDFNTFRRCIISVNPNSNQPGNYSGIVVSGSTNPAYGAAESDNNLFEDNSINGGFYGMTLIGSDDIANGNNIIRRNTFTNFYNYGIYVSKSFNTTIDSNIISCPQRISGGSFNGIMFAQLSTSARVTRNIITNPYGSAPLSTDGFAGISFSNCSTFPGLENIVSNNLIYNITGNGDVYALYNANSANVRYYHNTLHLDGVSSSGSRITTAFYQAGDAPGLEFKNNIISITRGGKHSKYAYYFGQIPTEVAIDYNDIAFLTTEGTASVGFYDQANRITMTNWQTASGQDAHSVSFDPVYANPALGNFRPTNASINDLGTALATPVTVDITGTTRSAPDPGAYEFTPVGCTVPPTPGVATLSESTVCITSNVILNTAGNSFGLNQTYQWQSSANVGGPYTSVSTPLTNPRYAIAATSTMYYRLAVTCSGNTAYTTPVLLTVNNALPGGTYIIDKGGSGNFISFTEAKNAIACGISGPVVFNVKAGSGPYLERMELDSIPGTSVVNTITFNGNGNELSYLTATNVDIAAIKLNGADHIIIDSLLISVSSGPAASYGYGWGVQLAANADSNIIRRCTIDVMPRYANDGGGFAGIVVSSNESEPTNAVATFCDGNIFEDNLVKGGYYSITLVGSDAVPNANNIIRRNTFTDFIEYGIYVRSTSGTVIDQNIITRPTRSPGYDFKGISFYYGNNSGAVVTRNTITNPFGGNPTAAFQFYGISFTNSNSIAGQENLVSNNVIYNITGNGNVFGIFNESSSFVNYYHNTILLDGAVTVASRTTRGFYKNGTGQGISFKNNIIAISRTGNHARHAMHINGPISSDYNNLYFLNSGNNNIGYSGFANRTTLADWQAAGNDAHSISEDPDFPAASLGGLKPRSALIDNLGTVLTPAVTDDFEGAARNATTPDMGAYEFTPNPCVTPPVAGISTVSETPLCVNREAILNVTGNTSGLAQTYQWEASSDLAGAYSAISGLLVSPQFKITSSDTLYYRVAVTCGGNTVYSAPVKLSVIPAMAGDYTIDPALPAGDGNFTSFFAAAEALRCGIAGNVRFIAAPGTYEEQFTIGTVPGASATARVTFQSRDNDPASVIVKYSGTALSDKNYIIKIDGGQFLTFKAITVTAGYVLEGLEGYNMNVAIRMVGNCSSDSIVNSVITTVASADYPVEVACIVGDNLGESTDVVISGNKMTTDGNGMFLSGGYSDHMPERFIINNNNVECTGANAIYADRIKQISITDNKIRLSMDPSQYWAYMSFGIASNGCGDGYRIDNNDITILNMDVAAIGIYVSGGYNSDAVKYEKGSVSGNKITAESTNTSSITGIDDSANGYCVFKNNAVSVNTTGLPCYGITSNYSDSGIVYYNNSVINLAPGGEQSIAANFPEDYGVKTIRNNIFSHQAEGVALLVDNPKSMVTDYNMLYTAGAVLVKSYKNPMPGFPGDGLLRFATLKDWTAYSYRDKNSIVYKPAFTSNTDLTPDAASPDVWAIHGRGVQIAGNATDINNKPRPTTLTEGVPDLGAYEFVPSSVPVPLTAIPAVPAVNANQVFMMGTDTVARIKWGATVPATIEGRRYSGILPDGLATGQAPMYFYNDFNTTGTAPTGHNIEQYFIDSWLGFVPEEGYIKMGRTNTAGSWDIAPASTIDTINNIITENGLTVLKKLTGLSDGNRSNLTNPVVISPVTVSLADSSNSGKLFWLGYGLANYFESNGQDMVIYLSAGDTAAIVNVKINGTQYMKTYHVPANSSVATIEIPKYGEYDARLLTEGLYDRGISIESDVPITAESHVYSTYNSGSTMLLPVGTYGYEYYALSYKPYFGDFGEGYSYFYVVAAYDSTLVEITPSQATQGGHAAGVPFTVALRKGEIYQVLGAVNETNTDKNDLTGSRIRSISHADGKCYPIGVFSGSSSSGISCDDEMSGSQGSTEVLLQQNFPTRAWGKRYLTAPTSHGSAAQLRTNVYRVMVKDPATVVKRNGVVLTDIRNNMFYHFSSNVPEYIEADQPVMVAQFIPSSVQCDGLLGGDGEIMYISPLEQAIKEVIIYRATTMHISEQYVTLTIPSTGMQSLTIDGTNDFDHVYDHPGLPGYKVVVRRWAANNRAPGTSGATIIKSDSAFTAITYGLAMPYVVDPFTFGAESYGYNAGAYVKNLQMDVNASIANVLSQDPGASSPFTCAGTPFKLKFLSSVEPTKIQWNLKTVANMLPNDNVTVNNPVASGTKIINGVTYYEYTLPSDYVFSQPGNYVVTADIFSPKAEGCSGSLLAGIPVKVVEAPVTDFDVTGNCLGGNVQFNGHSDTQGIGEIRSWLWDFADAGATANIQNTFHSFTNNGTYQVKLSTTATSGCLGEKMKPVTIGAGPAVVLINDSLAICVGEDATFAVQSPVAGAVYNWYDAPTGGNLVHTGTSFTLNNVTGPVVYRVGSDLNGCLSKDRKEAEIAILPKLTAPVAAVDSAAVNAIRFRWMDVAGATGYEVSVNSGTWITPSSGTTGLTHLVSNLSLGQTVVFKVRALGGCEPAESQAVTATTVTDEIFVPNAFTPNGSGPNENERLKVYGNAIRELRFLIFNQWGQKIFETRDRNGYWDGKQGGKLQPSGVYIYTAEVIMNDGRRVVKKGAVTLVR